MNNYIITNNTLAIMPYGKGKSKVYENKREFLINKNPKKIINYNLLCNGTTYEGRKKFSENVTGCSYKVPLLLNNAGNIILFPTESPRLHSCCWFNYKNIKNYYENDKGFISISFYDGKTVEINSSVNIIKNQIMKSSFLNYRIQQN